MFFLKFTPVNSRINIINLENLYITPTKVLTVKRCDLNIKSALKLADEMIELAEKGDADRTDTGCGILYGIIRDSAWKIKKTAELEKNAHIKKGWWVVNK